MAPELLARSIPTSTERKENKNVQTGSLSAWSQIALPGNESKSTPVDRSDIKSSSILLNQVEKKLPQECDSSLPQIPQKQDQKESKTFPTGVMPDIWIKDALGNDTKEVNPDCLPFLQTAEEITEEDLEAAREIEAEELEAERIHLEEMNEYPWSDKEDYEAHHLHSDDGYCENCLPRNNTWHDEAYWNAEERQDNKAEVKARSEEVPDLPMTHPEEKYEEVNSSSIEDHPSHFPKNEAINNLNICQYCRHENIDEGRFRCLKCARLLPIRPFLTWNCDGCEAFRISNNDIHCPECKESRYVDLKLTKGEIPARYQY